LFHFTRILLEFKDQDEFKEFESFYWIWVSDRGKEKELSSSRFIIRFSDLYVLINLPFFDFKLVINEFLEITVYFDLLEQDFVEFDLIFFHFSPYFLQHIVFFTKLVELSSVSII